MNTHLLSFALVHTVDCSVQTEAMSAEVLYAYDNPAAIDDEFKGNELVLDINSKPRVVSWETKPRSTGLNLDPRVSHLIPPSRSPQGGGGKMRDPGNEVAADYSFHELQNKTFAVYH